MQDAVAPRFYDGVCAACSCEDIGICAFAACELIGVVVAREGVVASTADDVAHIGHRNRIDEIVGVVGDACLLRTDLREVEGDFSVCPKQFERNGVFLSTVSLSRCCSVGDNDEGIGVAYDTCQLFTQIRIALRQHFDRQSCEVACRGFYFFGIEFEDESALLQICFQQDDPMVCVRRASWRFAHGQIDKISIFRYHNQVCPRRRCGGVIEDEANGIDDLIPSDGLVRFDDGVDAVGSFVDLTDVVVLIDVSIRTCAAFEGGALVVSAQRIAPVATQNLIEILENAQRVQRHRVVNEARYRLSGEPIVPCNGIDSNPLTGAGNSI